MELDPGWTPQAQGLKNLSNTLSITTRMLAEDLGSDQDWWQYLLQYLDEAVMFCNARHPDISQL
jgi:hypothetical protein